MPTIVSYQEKNPEPRARNLWWDTAHKLLKYLTFDTLYWRHTPTYDLLIDKRRREHVRAPWAKWGSLGAFLFNRVKDGAIGEIEVYDLEVRITVYPQYEHMVAELAKVAEVYEKEQGAFPVTITVDDPSEF